MSRLIRAPTHLASRLLATPAGVPGSLAGEALLTAWLSHPTPLAARSAVPLLLSTLAGDRERPVDKLLRGPFAARAFSTAEQQRSGKQSEAGAGAGAASEETALTVEEERARQLSADLMRRPLGVAEGGSYLLVILGGVGLAVAVLWAAVNELLLQPREHSAFALALERLRDDPRILVTLGTPLSGYGQESRNRRQRQQIPNRSYTDGNGVQHLQVQFYVRGSTGRGRVSADMYQDEKRNWQFYYLYVDLDDGRARISIQTPQT